MKLCKQLLKESKQESKHAKLLAAHESTPHSQMYKRFKKSDMNLASAMQSCGELVYGSRSATKAEKKFNRKFFIDLEEKGNSIETGNLVHIVQKSQEIDKFDISPFKLGIDFIEGDRMIPLRAAEMQLNKPTSSMQDLFDQNNIYEIKLAIENNPPEFLNEDKRLE